MRVGTDGNLDQRRQVASIEAAVRDMLPTMNSAADTPAPLPHVVREGVIVHEATWRLKPDALELTGGGQATADAVRSFPYRDITAIRLSFAPSRVDAARYRCDIAMRSGQRLKILSTHYRGFASFEDRAATYSPFVRGLIARVAAANPTVRLRSGKSVLVYLAEHLFLVLAFAALIGILSVTGVSYISDSSAVRIAIIAFFIPLLVVYTRKNWPRRFNADAIPDGVLPA